MPTRLLCALAAGAVLLTACGGNNGDELNAGPTTSRKSRFPAAVVSTTTPSTTPFGQPVRASTTTTQRKPSTGTTAPPATTTTAVPGRTQPLEVPLPVARTGVAGTAWQGLVVLAGGEGSGGRPSVRVDAFDPKAGTWSRGPNLPVALRDASLAVLGEDLWLVGGFAIEGDQAVAQAKTYSFHPGDDEWKAGPELRTARGGAAVTTLRNFLVVLGGETSDGTVLDTVEALALGGPAWRVGKPMTQPRAFASALTVNNRVYAVGGKTASAPASNTVESWSGGSSSWRTESRLDKERVRSSGAATCVAGGQNDTGVVTTIECFGTGFWVTHAEMRVARYGLAAVILDGWLHLIGGSTADASVSSAHEVFDLAVAAG